MRRPVILWVVVVVGIATALLNLLEVLGGVMLARQLPIQMTVMSLLILVTIAAASSWIVVSLLRKTIRSTVPVSIYLWFLLLIYPVTNVLRGLGLFLPGPVYRPEELGGAAVAEVLRYVMLIGLIVWVGLSKTLKSYLSGPVAADA